TLIDWRVRTIPQTMKAQASQSGHWWTILVTMKKTVRMPHHYRNKHAWKENGKTIWTHRDPRLQQDEQLLEHIDEALIRILRKATVLLDSSAGSFSVVQPPRKLVHTRP